MVCLKCAQHEKIFNNEQQLSVGYSSMAAGIRIYCLLERWQLEKLSQTYTLKNKKKKLYELHNLYMLSKQTTRQQSMVR